MLAVLGYLPMDDVKVANKNSNTFPTEVNYILLADTLKNNDSLVIRIPNSKLPDSGYFRVLAFENHRSDTIIYNHDSLITSKEVDCFVLNDPNISK